MGWRLDDLSPELRSRVVGQIAAEDAARRGTPTIVGVDGAAKGTSILTDLEKGQAVNRAGARLEVKELHVPFRQWLGLHRLPHVYAQPNKASTIRTGWPDFTVLHAGRACAVEFKWPGQKLRPEQAGVRAELESDGTPYLLAYTVAEAIGFVREALGVTVEAAAQ